MVPQTVGGIKAGMSFSANSFGGKNWPLTEVVKSLLYPYVPPKINIDLVNTSSGNNFAEFGFTQSLRLNYTITVYPRTLNEYVRDFAITTGTTKLLLTGNPSAQPASGLSFSSTYPGRTFTGGITISNVNNTTPNSTTTIYSMYLTDIVGGSNNSFSVNSFSHSATASLNWIYPIYYGFTSSIIGNVNNYRLLNKKIIGYPGLSNSVYLNYSGSNQYLYFAYPLSSSFATPVSLIKDPNGFVIYSANTGIQNSSFTASSVTDVVTAPLIPLRTTYVVWRTTDPVGANGQFEFKF
jgi:hypothetical protein